MLSCIIPSLLIITMGTYEASVEVVFQAFYFDGQHFNKKILYDTKFKNMYYVFVHSVISFGSQKICDPKVLYRADLSLVDQETPAAKSASCVLYAVSREG